MGGSTITESHEREVYLNFWNRFADRADNGSMMLNRNAEEFEARDRADIIDSLPDYTGLDVVDIGAGIGRFTSHFAQQARHVISTDFIDNFIAKNRERNAHHSNITYKVSDAVGLNLPPRSVDFVFTNWLLMVL